MTFYAPLPPPPPLPPKRRNGLQAVYRNTSQNSNSEAYSMRILLKTRILTGKEFGFDKRREKREARREKREGRESREAIVECLQHSISSNIVAVQSETR